MNPLGNASSHSEPRIIPGRTTHKKGCMLLANPHAISRNSFLPISAILPKLTYNTDFGFWVFSQDMELISSVSRLLDEAGKDL
ncbi:hypothetical protein RHGRI_027567 [Rhododendron griersonianum]|uniref:Uncharacterized protein n=1 Tax=Rhododendron griersonianum TaxID=479676 RepID=A0AAV6IXC3_9ERIC|nr:hypothetical protein RHGRI_027567 [Rhododendron griersonianum]